MANRTTSIRLPEDVLRSLDELAGATARNRNYLITEAVKEYVARETWHLQRIREGLRQLEAGEIASGEQMDEFWAGWITPEAPAQARAETAAELITEAMA
jgi:RHH-type transcriptional regulator, rel operon repressor / antitoxin RelB